MILPSKSHGNFEIIDIEKRTTKSATIRIFVIRFLDTGTIKRYAARYLTLGKVVDDTIPTIYGKGLVFKGVTISHKREYHLWHNMMKRCYGENNPETMDKTYKGVEVHKDWWDIKNFLNDLPQLKGYKEWKNGEDYQLDKDLLSRNKKIYSKETCQFIPTSTNARHARSPHSKTVVHVETGEEYESMSKASKAIGVSRSNISSECHGKRGKRFRFKDPEHANSTGAKEPRKVMHVETGIIFPSLTKAAKHFNKSCTKAISECAKVGKTWKFVD